MPLDAPHAILDDSAIIKGLQEGNERVFEQVVERYSASLLRLAMAYVASRAIAEEVVQETWMGVFEGIGRFEGRSTFQTWLFRIVSNRAKTRGVRESRYEPVGWGYHADAEDGVNLEERLFVGEGTQKGHWKTPPQYWEADTPERALLSKECRKTIEEAIASLPPTQRQVMTLRDLEGVSSEDTCNILGVSETNQRVLLHRARTKVRHLLAQYVDADEKNKS